MVDTASFYRLFSSVSTVQGAAGGGWVRPSSDGSRKILECYHRDNGGNTRDETPAVRYHHDNVWWLMAGRRPGCYRRDNVESVRLGLSFAFLIAMPTIQNTPLWSFPAEVVRVVDGDTLDYRCDLGFHLTTKNRLRLRGVDTAEIYGVPEESDEYKRGKKHLEFVEDWIASHSDGEQRWPLTLITQQEIGIYGRWVGDLAPRDGEGRWLTEALISEFPEVES